MEPYSMRLPDDLRDKGHEAAAELGIDLANLIRLAARERLDREARNKRPIPVNDRGGGGRKINVRIDPTDMKDYRAAAGASVSSWLRGALRDKLERRANGR